MSYKFSCFLNCFLHLKRETAFYHCQATPLRSLTPSSSPLQKSAEIWPLEVEIPLPTHSPTSPCHTHPQLFLPSVTFLLLGFPGGPDSKESAYNGRDQGSIPGSGRSPGEEHGNSLQYSYLENPMDRETWQASVNGVTEARVGRDLVTKPPSPLPSQ